MKKMQVMFLASTGIALTMLLLAMGINGVFQWPGIEERILFHERPLLVSSLEQVETLVSQEYVTEFTIQSATKDGDGIQIPFHTLGVGYISEPDRKHLSHLKHKTVWELLWSGRGSRSASKTIEVSAKKVYYDLQDVQERLNKNQQAYILHAKDALLIQEDHKLIVLPEERGVIFKAEDIFPAVRDSLERCEFQPILLQSYPMDPKVKASELSRFRILLGEVTDDTGYGKELEDLFVLSSVNNLVLKPGERVNLGLIIQDALLLYEDHDFDEMALERAFGNVIENLNILAQKSGLQIDEYHTEKFSVGGQDLDGAVRYGLVVTNPYDSEILFSAYMENGTIHLLSALE